MIKPLYLYMKSGFIMILNYEDHFLVYVVRLSTTIE